MSLSFNTIYQLSKSEDYAYFIDLDAMHSYTNNFIRTWKRQFPNIEFAYSYKSNNLESVTTLMRKLGLVAEVVSWHELQLALKDGFKGSDIYFDGAVKLEKELRYALQNNVNIQCDALTELEEILQLSNEMKLIPNISFRLSAFYRECGLSRFGMNQEELAEALVLLDQHDLPCSGLHFHAGSNLTSAAPIISCLRNYRNEIKLLKDGLKFIDIGGGYPALTSGRKPLSIIKKYISEIHSELTTQKINLDNVKLVLEPGRCLTEDFGYLITRIVSCKTRYGTNILTVAAPGLNIRSAQYHENRQVFVIPLRLTDKEKSLADVYGSNCYESDVIARNIEIPEDLDFEDRILITSCGAYDIMNSSNWIRKRPTVFIYSMEKHRYEHYRFSE